MESARVYGILAPEANQVVLFRRGPSKLTLQLVWDLVTDEITSGQWIRGTVYVERCDVSPDGRYLVAAISNYAENRHHQNSVSSWTAISRSPFFTALAMWDSVGSYGGGGVWSSNRDVWLNNLISLQHDFDCWKERKGVEPPVTARLLHSQPSREPGLRRLILIKQGWQEEATFENVLAETGRGLEDLPLLQQGIAFDDFLDWYSGKSKTEERFSFLRAFPTGLIRTLPTTTSSVWQLLDRSGQLAREWASSYSRPFWLEVDHNGWPIFSEKGCIYRWTNFPNGEPTLVADLNHYTFEPVAPPAWATKW